MLSQVRVEVVARVEVVLALLLVETVDSVRVHVDDRLMVQENAGRLVGRMQGRQAAPERLQPRV